MRKSLEIKLMIIENFIDHWTPSEGQREKMKEVARQYVEEDHVDEIEQAGFSRLKDLPTISKLDVQVVDKNDLKTLKATSVEGGLIVRMTAEKKDELVNKELVHFDGFEWKFFDSDLKEVRRIAEY